jgi:phage tail-like protein
MPLIATSKLGVAMRFKVVVDDIDLGGWSNCTGLSVDFKNKKVAEGGNYEYNRILPERVEYKAVTLKRAMNSDDSAKVQSWLSKVVSSWYNASSPTDYGPRTARITLFDANGGQVASWSLRNVYPQKWSGPDLDATGTRVAFETLELIHEGFL